MESLFSSKNQSRAYLLLAGILFGYLTLRVILVPLVHDEAASFFFYIQTGNFWFYKAHWDANNHVLNSLLTWLSYRAFGDSLLALRLPNLLSFTVFLFYTWKTGQTHLEGIKKHAFILSLWCCHIYFEHFGYARGYGMSFAFLAAALYYLLQIGRQYSLKNLVLLCVFTLLAMFANLTLLPLGTTIIGAAIFLWLADFKKIKTANRVYGAILFLFSTAVIAYFAVFSFELKDRNLLYYGGLEGIIPDTLQSISMGLFRINNWWLGWGLLLTMVVSIIPLPVMIFRQGLIVVARSPYGIFSALLLVMLLSIVLMNLLLGVNFPTFRTALYLIPLFFGALAFWPEWKLKVHPSLLLPVFMVVFVFQVNTSYAWYWKWERMSPRLYQSALNKLPKQEYPPLTGGYHLLGLRWALYGYHEQQKMGNWNRDGYPSLIPDVQVLFPQDVDDEWKKYYIEVDRDEYSDFPLYIRKEPCPRKSVQQANFEEGQPEMSHEFIDLITLESPAHEAYMAGIKMQLVTKKVHQEIFLVMSCHDEGGNNLGYQAMPLHWHYDDVRHANIEASLFLVKPEKQAVQLKVYLWNLSKEPYKLVTSKTELFELYPDSVVSKSN
jgi:hypothetical protein